jgi:N-acetylmuramoyl-L-alanine amidase
MRGILPTIALRVVAGFGLLGSMLFANAADIRTLQVTSSNESTRAIFDISGPLDYKLFEIANPDRIVLDIRASNWSDGFSVPAGKGLLKSIRTGKQGKTDVRVVFDLAGGVRPKSFVMPPDGRAGYRLVVDLFPQGKAKPGAIKSAQALAEKPRNVLVAIDPGHGGVDPGAIGGSGTHEKEITLAVSRELKRLIDQQPGMSAALVRDGDYFVSLEDRYRKAREMKADLFVSVHADAFTDADARGSSVWMLSARGATSEAARWLADRENRADLVGGVSLSKDSTLAAVLLDLSQGATLEASGAVADQVLKALSKLGPTHRGYVEKANFVVLRSPDVPSILVETAFITNPSEEKRLKNAEQREKLAGAILDGVRNYFRAAPPPGTMFAMKPSREKSETPIVAKRATKNALAQTRTSEEDVEYAASVARVPKS